MATKTPIANYSGELKEIQSGDTIPAAIIPSLSGTYQPLDSDLTTLAANITAFGHSLVDDANAAAAIATLGLAAIYVPYTGATANVNLGARALSTTGAAAFGNVYAGNLATAPYGGYSTVFVGGTANGGALDFHHAGTRIGQFYTLSGSFNFFTDTSKTLNFYVNNDFSVAAIAVGTGRDTTFGGNVITSTRNIVTDTTTGTKIGTATGQKLGLWNATPIIQPTTAVAAATFAANTSGIANDTATVDGYTIGQVVKALRNIGALA